jgi:hypothetical protein
MNEIDDLEQKLEELPTPKNPRKSWPKADSNREQKSAHH